jgi:sulfur carrier protein
VIDIVLNGDGHRLCAGATLLQLVESLGLADHKVALAVNRWVVPRERWRDTPLAPHDRVDVVRAIGGG